MRTVDFDYCLPSELIAHKPCQLRDQSRLLLLRRADNKITHSHFRNLPEQLRCGDVLILNDSRVIPARLRGRKQNTGGQIEILLVRENVVNDWWAMVRPGKRVRCGTKITITTHSGEATGREALVLGKNEEGHCRLRIVGTPDISGDLDRLGEIPLPPYILHEKAVTSVNHRERYQTIFAQPPGSVAAPTAGLHFTQRLLDEIRARGVQICFVTLHVGLGTFTPVKSDELENHVMHEERFKLNAVTANLINEAKQARHRVMAVGTTTLRVLESVAQQHCGKLVECEGWTRIFIYPPFRFQIVDALLTNFHLPQSTLLMLVSAFASPDKKCGRDLVLSAYHQAIHERYRFYSYGDAMLIL